MRSGFVVAVLLVVLLAGCAAKKDDDKGDGSGTTSTSASTTAAPTRHDVTLTAFVGNGTAPNGTVPLDVNFTLNATTGFTAWHLGFGDGQDTNGTATMPATYGYTYGMGGNFTANLTVTYPGGSNVSATVNITVAVPAGHPAPDVTHFEFDESLGCAGDAGADKCISFQGGPDASGIDGYWLALDERYWGLQLTSTVDSAVGDSDCAFTDAARAIIGTANNSNSPCAGPVPDGAAFLFIYPYAAPALGMTVDFGTA